MSVVVTTFNHGDLVVTAIESVLRQTRRPLEVIVVDDGSSDGTASRLRRAFGSTINYIYQDNTGIAGSRNRGIDAATGELVALMDGDDIWHERKLELQAYAYRRFPDSGIVAVGIVVFSSASPAPDTRLSEPIDISTSSAHVLERLLHNNFLATTSQVAIPRKILKAVGPSNRSYRTCSDFDLYCRIAIAHPITVVDAPLTYWRHHPTSASGHRHHRQLTWGPEVVDVIRALSTTTTGPVQATFLTALERKRRQVGWEALAFGLTHARPPALKVLLRLLRDAPVDWNLLGYLLAILAPIPRWAWKRSNLLPAREGSVPRQVGTG